MIPSILEPDKSHREHRRNWARLIQKIYEIDPLTCPKCQGRMLILAFIENPEIIKKILKHLDLWDLKARPPPRANAPPPNIQIYNSARPARPGATFLEDGVVAANQVWARGATHLPVAAQPMHYSKCDFLRIQCW